jgi:CNT family concentrative nucleoside transporter
MPQLAELKNPANAVHLVHQKISHHGYIYAFVVSQNFASIGIQIGGIGSLAPGQRQNIVRVWDESTFGEVRLLHFFSATIIGALM